MDLRTRKPAAPRSRGSALLLDHCARLERLAGADAGTARGRLDAALGPELAAVLVGALAGDHRPPWSLGACR